MSTPGSAASYWFFFPNLWIQIYAKPTKKKWLSGVEALHQKMYMLTKDGERVPRGENETVVKKGYRKWPLSCQSQISQISQLKKWTLTISHWLFLSMLGLKSTISHMLDKHSPSEWHSSSPTHIQTLDCMFDATVNPSTLECWYWSPSRLTGQSPLFSN
jgi:hypothetical protein